MEKRGIRHYPTTAVGSYLDSKAVQQFSPNYLVSNAVVRGYFLPQASVTTVVREIRTFVRLCRLNSCSQKNSPKGLVRSFDFFISYPTKTGRSFLVRCVPHTHTQTVMRCVRAFHFLLCIVYIVYCVLCHLVITLISFHGSSIQ